MGNSNGVVTVTINPAIDHTLCIPNFAAGTVNRVRSSRLDAGGKGINVASFLADFGHPVTVTGFLGADNDDIFRRLFERKSIEDRCVRVAGQTRIGIKVTDDVLHQTTDINFPGQTPGPGDIERLFEMLAELAGMYEWFVLSGSIPAGVSVDIYADMLRALVGKKVVLDTSGEGLHGAVGVGATSQRPDGNGLRLIKPNVAELRELTREPLDSPGAILEAARRLRARCGITGVVVSMGHEGAIFVAADEALWAVPPAVTVKSTVGAGDAMVAGMVAGKLRGLALADCARLATAFAAIAISHEGHELSSVADIEAACARVTIREAPPTH